MLRVRILRLVGLCIMFMHCMLQVSSNKRGDAERAAKRDRWRPRRRHGVTLARDNTRVCRLLRRSRQRGRNSLKPEPNNECCVNIRAAAAPVVPTQCSYKLEHDVSPLYKGHRIPPQVCRVWSCKRSIGFHNYLGLLLVKSAY